MKTKFLTGINAIDKALGGVEKGNLYIVSDHTKSNSLKNVVQDFLKDQSHKIILCDWTDSMLNENIILINDPELKNVVLLDTHIKKLLLEEQVNIVIINSFQQLNSELLDYKNCECEKDAIMQFLVSIACNSKVAVICLNREENHGLKGLMSKYKMNRRIANIADVEIIYDGQYKFNLSND